MILFRPEHVEPILVGVKTQTRRKGKKRWNVGSVHQCRTRLFDPSSRFADVSILEVRSEQLGQISQEDAEAEGYDTPEDFFDAFERINGGVSLAGMVWVVRFELVTMCGSVALET